jgi:DNA-binding HxlR family transcriptional regulator
MKKEKCNQAGLFGVCPFVTAQQVLQGKWAILILHELSNGPKRFNEIQKNIEVTQTTLSTQLKKLQNEGIISRTVYPEVPPRVEYELTDIGQSFGPVLDSIEVWGVYRLPKEKPGIRDSVSCGNIPGDVIYLTYEQ